MKCIALAYPEQRLTSYKPLGSVEMEQIHRLCAQMRYGDR